MTPCCSVHIYEFPNKEVGGSRVYKIQTVLCSFSDWNVLINRDILNLTFPTTVQLHASRFPEDQIRLRHTQFILPIDIEIGHVLCLHLLMQTTDEISLSYEHGTTFTASYLEPERFYSFLIYTLRANATVTLLHTERLHLPSHS